MSRFNLLANSRPGNGPSWGFVLARYEAMLTVAPRHERPAAVAFMAPRAAGVPERRRPALVTLRSAFDHRSHRAVKGQAAVRRGR